MSAGAARMNDAFGNALMVEVSDFFAQDQVFQQRGPARVGLQRILVVADDQALIGGERDVVATGLLVQFAAFSDSRVGELWGCWQWCPGRFFARHDVPRSVKRTMRFLTWRFCATAHINASNKPKKTNSLGSNIFGPPVFV